MNSRKSPSRHLILNRFNLRHPLSDGLVLPFYFGYVLIWLSKKLAAFYLEALNHTRLNH